MANERFVQYAETKALFNIVGFSKKEGEGRRVNPRGLTFAKTPWQHSMSLAVESDKGQPIIAMLMHL